MTLLWDIGCVGSDLALRLMNTPLTAYDLEVLLTAEFMGWIQTKSDLERNSVTHLMSKGLMSQDGLLSFITLKGIDAASRLRTGS